MFADKFLHPNHIVPLVELVTALFECADKSETHMLVELHTVVCQMPIFIVRIRNTSIHIKNVLFLGARLNLHILSQKAD